MINVRADWDRLVLDSQSERLTTYFSFVLLPTDLKSDVLQLNPPPRSVTEVFMQKPPVTGKDVPTGR